MTGTDGGPAIAGKQPLGRASRPRKILVHGMNHAPEPTGVGRYTGEIVAYLVERGHEVDVITTAPHYPGWATKAPYTSGRYYVESAPGLHVIRCPLLLRREMRGIWRVLAPLTFAASSAPVAAFRILRRRPDVVLCVEPTLFSAPLSVFTAWLVGARRVLHVQDIEVDAAFAVGHVRAGGIAAKLAFAFDRFMHRRFDQIITISNQMRKALSGRAASPSQVAVVRNWVDLDQIRPLDTPNGYRRELGLSDQQFVALYAGNIGAKQALTVILEAALRLRDRADVTFVIAGDGPEKPALVEKYGQLPNVRFLPIQPEARLCELLNLADVHVLPQHAGVADLVLPSKLGGMLASGKPSLVCADEGTELHGFLDGIAILVPPGDADAVARELSILIDNRAHPAIGDGRRLADELAKNVNLRRFEALLTGTPEST